MLHAFGNVVNAPIRWTEVQVLAPESWQELVAEALMVGPCTSVAFGRPSLGTDAPPPGLDYVRTFLPDHADTPAVRSELRAALAGLHASTGAAELRGLEPTFRSLPPEDYATSWMKTWRPFRVGRLCVLLPGKPRPLKAHDHVVWLEPGGAFGSGRHATTRMCLRALQAWDLTGTRVLDVGSGSGILSVAAVRFGAERALGIDNDPNAEPYARALARDNDLAERCEFRTGRVEDLPPADRGFDLVLANIYADVLQAHAADFRDRLVPGGRFVFSGCTSQHAARTMDAIRESLLHIEDVMIRGRWHTFVGVRTK